MMRFLMRFGLRYGVGWAMNAFVTWQEKRAIKSGQDNPQARVEAQNTSKRMRQMMRLTRRFLRF